MMADATKKTTGNSERNRGNIANLKPFKPGQSGNPSGRRKDRTVKALAREHTVAAIETLARILKDKRATPAAQISAAVALLDRGWGRPVQEVDLSSDGPALIMTVTAQRERLQERLNRIANGVNGAAIEFNGKPHH